MGLSSPCGCRGYFVPHSSGNAGAVRVFLTLHKKFGRQEWLERSIACADLLVSLARPSGVFGNSTAEFNPEEGCLIHNALPDIALLALAQYLSEKGLDPRKADRYVDVVKRNIDWFINYWWNGRYFCGTINQDLTALIAIALYEKVECPSGYGTYLHAVVDYIESMVEKDGPTAGGDPQKRRARRGRCWPRAIRRAKRFFSLSYPRCTMMSVCSPLRWEPLGLCSASSALMACSTGAIWRKRAN